MANKEILAVTIDDTEFSEFKKKFDAYEAAVKAMPKHWQQSSGEITAQKTNFEKMVAGAGNFYRSLELATVQQSVSSRVLEATGLAWAGIHRSGKLFRSDIVHATQSLMHWTKLTAVFSGLLGAGGLFGINRMAASVAGQRTSAAGLGVSYGEQASFLTNFGRLGNVEGILQGFAEAETDVSKKYALRQYLGHNESGSPSRDFAEGLGRFKQFVDQYKNQNELLGPMLHARGYDKLGIGTDTARIVQGMSAAEIAQISRGYQSGVAGRLGLSDADAKKWTEFSNQMERAGLEIETVFAKGTVKLARPLMHLSESFIHLTENLLKEGSPISGWIKGLGRGIRNFADTLGSGTIQANASKLGQDIADVVKLLDVIIAKAPGGLAVLLGIGVGARLGGAAAAIGGGLAAIPGVGAAAAAGALGATVMPQPLNAGEDERARQEKYKQGPYAPNAPGAIGYFNKGGYGPFSQNAEFGRDLNIPGPTVPHLAEGGIVTKRTVAVVGEKGPEAIIPLSGVNLGNIRARGGGWRKFETPADAAQAIIAQLSRYPKMFPRQRGIDTMAGAIKKYAPRGDRNNPDLYARQVEQWTGISRHAHMNLGDPEVAAKVAYGIARKEGHLGSRTIEDFRGMFIRHGTPLRHSFGHPHTGHHPATIGRRDAGITVQDNTGGLVSVSAH
jgi:hypothetical protein